MSACSRPSDRAALFHFASDPYITGRGCSLNTRPGRSLPAVSVVPPSKAFPLGGRCHGSAVTDEGPPSFRGVRRLFRRPSIRQRTLRAAMPSAGALTAWLPRKEGPSWDGPTGPKSRKHRPCVAAGWRPRTSRWIVARRTVRTLHKLSVGGRFGALSHPAPAPHLRAGAHPAVFVIARGHMPRGNPYPLSDPP